MYQDLYLNRFLKTLAFFHATLITLVACLIIAGLYFLNHPVLDQDVSRLPSSSRDELFMLQNPVVNFSLITMLVCLSWTALQYWKLARFQEPYISIRPNGLRLNDLPFMSAGMITWDNVAEIEENSGLFYLFRKQTVVVRLRDPGKFRFYPTSSERLINWILRVISLGFYEGPYLQNKIVIQGTVEMPVTELRSLIIERSGLQPKIKPLKIAKPRPQWGQLSFTSIFLLVAVAIGFELATKPEQMHEPKTDYTHAELIKLAENGDARSQSILGWRYFNGRGVENDDVLAFEWWLKAAEQGFTRAEGDVGWAYRTGRGVERNYEESFKWFSKAAAKGYTYAESNLGWLYGRGYGTERDYFEAFKWHKKAADKGYAHSESWVAWLYEKGYGVEKDHALALEYYQRAAAQNHKYSIKALKRLKG